VQIQLKSISSILLLLSAILVPMYFTDFRMHVGGLILRLADVMSLTIILLFIICKRFAVVQLYLPKGYAFLLLFVTYCFINGICQSGLLYTISETLQWLLMLSTLAIVYSQFVAHPKQFTSLFFKTLLVICLFIVLYHFSIGKFTHYKSLGDAKYVLALTGVLMLTYTYYYQDKRYLLPLCILYPFIHFSLERKGILAFHLVLFFYCCLSFKSLIRWGILFACFALFIFLLINPLLIDFSDFKIFEYSSYEMVHLDEEKAKWISNYHRQHLLESGWNIFINNVWFGVGPKMLTYSMLDYYTNSGLAIYTHNVFLDTLIEQGSIGLILLLLPYLVYLLTSKLNGRGEKEAFIGLTVYSLVMLFFMSGGAPSMVLLYLPLFSGFVLIEKEKHY
jgi:hypothetical protein